MHTNQSKPDGVLPFACLIRVGYKNVAKNFVRKLILSSPSQKETILSYIPLGYEHIRQKHRFTCINKRSQSLNDTPRKTSTALSPPFGGFLANVS
jgi:hypothetical protein